MFAGQWWLLACLDGRSADDGAVPGGLLSDASAVQPRLSQTNGAHVGWPVASLAVEILEMRWRAGGIVEIHTTLPGQLEPPLIPHHTRVAPQGAEVSEPQQTNLAYLLGHIACEVA